MRLQGHDKGAARFRAHRRHVARGRALFFTATIGGPIGRGQIFRLTLGEPSMLEVIAEVDDPDSARHARQPLRVARAASCSSREDGLGGNYLQPRDARRRARCRSRATRERAASSPGRASRRTAARCSSTCRREGADARDHAARSRATPRWRRHGHCRAAAATATARAAHAASPPGLAVLALAATRAPQARAQRRRQRHADRLSG